MVDDVVGRGLFFRDPVNHALEASVGKYAEIKVIKQTFTVGELGLMGNIEAVTKNLHRRVKAGKRNVDQVFIGYQQTGLIRTRTLQIGLQ